MALLPTDWVPYAAQLLEFINGSQCNACNLAENV